MVELVPVDHDPFADSMPPPGDRLRITVRPQRAREPQLVPVDHDPFAASPAPGVVEDVGKSFGSGLVRGTAQIAGMGGDISKALGSAIDKLEQSGVKVDRQAMLESLPSWLKQFHKTPAKPLGSSEIMGAIDTATGLPITSREPQTTAGTFARTAGEFVPGAMIGGGGMARNAVAFGVVPGLASEGAGQITKGTAAEPWARAGAALATGGGAAVLTRPRSAQQAIRGAMPEGISPAVIDDAQRLIDDAAQRGITVTWPEAIERVAPGQGVGLLNTQRVLESSRQTSGDLATTFAQRPGQIEQAARTELGQIAPQAAEPSMVGPAVGQAAEGAISDVRGAINTATRPLYDAARQQRIDPALFARVRQDPVFQEGLRRVRNDEFIGPTLRGMPDDSVAVVDAVKKQLDETGRNLRDPLAGTARNNYAASIVDQGNRRMVQAADISTGSVPASMGPLAGNPGFQGIRGSYEAARGIQEEARRRFLEPLLQGPLGKLAGRDRTTQEAINALFPKGPLPGSADEIATAVQALVQRNPTAARQIVRAHIESVFDRSTRALQSGENQWGGGTFASALVGNPQEAANLQAAVRALPNGDQIWAGFNRFVEIAQATATRQRIGSRTAFNAEDLKALAEGRAVSEVGKVAAAPQRILSALGDAWDKWQLGRNMRELSQILTDPRSADLLRTISRQPVGSRAGQAAAARALIIAGQSVRDRSEAGKQVQK